ncbi:MAG TPA: nuclear transport factor 2 family protein [Solirubrobacteraceae bacterium]|jgi:hypothetical protein|nr:nuclear transport factor 2 family protein [Solirubrobacteraceae bacterium]
MESQANRDPVALLAANLYVFGERDLEKRRAAVEQTYTDDVRFVDPDGESVGRQALADRAGELLDRAPQDAVLEEDSPRYEGPDSAALAWRFGPRGNPVARGVDFLTFRDGRVAEVRTLLAGPGEA